MNEPRLRPARERQEIPEPLSGVAGVTIQFHVGADVAYLLNEEVNRRNQSRAVSRDWTLERLLEAIVKERFPT